MQRTGFVAIVLTVAWGAGSGAWAAISLSAPPILHYTFDTLDISGATVTNRGTMPSRNGTIVNAVSTAGQFGQALLFNPASGWDYVTAGGPVLGISNPGSGVQAYTVAAWLNAVDAAPQGGIVSQYPGGGDGWGLWYNRSGNENVSWWHGTLGDVALGGSNLADSTWRHIVWTRDSAGNLKLYLDGNTTPAATGVDTHALAFANEPFRVGVFDASDGLLAFTGAIDDVAVYDFALSASDVQAINAQGIPEPSALALLGFGAIALLRSRFVR